jgi:hypothetical protein
MKKIFITIAIIFGAFLFQFCSSTKKVTATDEGASAKLVAKAMYLTDVKPLLADKCTPCHFPPNGHKKPLDSYSSAKENIDDIISRIEKNPDERGFMPLKHAKLSDSAIQVFKQWKLDGLAE